MPIVPVSHVPLVVDAAALDAFWRDFPESTKFLAPLVAALTRLHECGLAAESQRAFAALRDALAGVEFVDRKNIGTEETSAKKHARFWPPALMASLKARGIRVLLLRLIAGSDLRVCIAFQDQDPAALGRPPTGRPARVLVYRVFSSPHTTDAGSGANRAYVPLLEQLDAHFEKKSRDAEEGSTRVKAKAKSKSKM